MRCNWDYLNAADCEHPSNIINPKNHYFTHCDLYLSQNLIVLLNTRPCYFFLKKIHIKIMLGEVEQYCSCLVWENCKCCCDAIEPLRLNYTKFFISNKAIAPLTAPYCSCVRRAYDWVSSLQLTISRRKGHHSLFKTLRFSFIFLFTKIMPLHT